MQIVPMIDELLRYAALTALGTGIACLVVIAVGAVVVLPWVLVLRSCHRGGRS